MCVCVCVCVHARTLTCILLCGWQLHVAFSVLCYTEVTSEWTEDSVKLCLGPFLGLVSQNHKLIHE